MVRSLDPYLLPPSTARLNGSYIPLAERRTRRLRASKNRSIITIRFAMARQMQGSLIVGIFAVIEGSHENNVFFFVDFIKKPPRADAVAPGLGFPVLQFFDIG